MNRPAAYSMLPGKPKMSFVNWVLPNPSRGLINVRLNRTETDLTWLVNGRACIKMRRRTISGCPGTIMKDGNSKASFEYGSMQAE